MKKHLQKIMVLVLALVLMMGGCGKKNTEENTQAETTTAADGGSTASGETEAETIEPPVQIENISEYVTLGQYKGVEAEKASDELTEDEIAEAIQQFCEAYAEPEQITEGTVAEGDTVYIDYVGKIDGAEFSGGTGDYELTIGSDSFIDGFEDGLIGVEVGSTVDLNLKFADDYHNADVAGKDVVFTVTVHYIIGEDVVPEFDDALAAELEFADAAAMRADLVEYLQSQKTSTVQSNFESAAWMKVVENCEILKEHEEIYNSYYENFLAQYEYVASMYGFTLEQYLSLAGADTTEFYAMADEYAKACMNQELICRAIVVAEGLTVSEEDYKAMLSDYYATYGDYFEDEAALETYYGKERLECDILWSQAIDLIMTSAVPVEPSTEAETTAAAE